MIKCHQCGRDNEDTEQICVYCGAALIDLLKQAATRNIDEQEEDPKFKTGSANFTPRSTLVLQLLDSKKMFIYDANDVRRLVIGRKDPDGQTAPDIDLTEFSALEMGVSRQHAHIVLQNGSLHIVDNGTPNGTFLNGQKLAANQPRLLRDGDDILLGRLGLRVLFDSG